MMAHCLRPPRLLTPGRRWDGRGSALCRGMLTYTTCSAACQGPAANFIVVAQENSPHQIAKTSRAGHRACSARSPAATTSTNLHRHLFEEVLHVTCRVSYFLACVLHTSTKTVRSSASSVSGSGATRLSHFPSLLTFRNKHPFTVDRCAKRAVQTCRSSERRAALMI